MDIVVNRLLAPVTALGPGRRAALWVQGCTLACPGCASRDTWPLDGGTTYQTGDLAAAISQLVVTQQLDGLTITGGEPLLQADAVASVLTHLKLELPSLRLHVLVFTGFAWAAARRRAGQLLDLVDCFVAGPYRANRPPLAGQDPLIASANQELVHLRPPPAEPPWPRRVEMQVLVEGGDLLMVGLPRPGDLDRVRAKLADRGVVLGGVSWQG
jgi:anaerobic ribonucleoside-triphosphate reductase activating protein